MPQKSNWLTKISGYIGPIVVTIALSIISLFLINRLDKIDNRLRDAEIKDSKYYAIVDEMNGTLDNFSVEFGNMKKEFGDQKIRIIIIEHNLNHE